MPAAAVARCHPVQSTTVDAHGPDTAANDLVEFCRARIAQIRRTLGEDIRTICNARSKLADITMITGLRRERDAWSGLAWNDERRIGDRGDVLRAEAGATSLRSKPSDVGSSTASSVTMG